jgi:N-acyl-D-aspartate/D-glutamate deacylase
MKQEFISFDTDAGPAPTDGAQRISHPRAYGAFPRVLGRYVRDLGVISLEGAVQRMSAAAANEIMAYDRGRLSVGLAADIVVFDENSVRDRATFAEPDLPAEGIRYVLVNGALVIENGKYTGALPGQVLRSPHATRRAVAATN